MYIYVRKCMCMRACLDVYMMFVCIRVHICVCMSVYVCVYVCEGNVLVNDAHSTFYLRLYGVTHMVNDHSDSERGYPLPPHGLLFPISSKGSFICTIPLTG